MEWTVKYRPKTPADYIGVKNDIGIMSHFLENFIYGNPQRRAIILYGDPGNGKTSMIYSLEKTYDLNVIEVNASNHRNANDIQALIRRSGANHLDGKYTVLLLDEIDGVNSWDAIDDLIEQTQCPLIMTCNDIDKVPYDTLKNCLPVEIKYPPKYQVAKRLEYIAKNEGYDVPKNVIDAIVDRCISMRSSILTLQECAISSDMTFDEGKLIDIDRNEREQIMMLFSGNECNIDVDPPKIKKWAITNGIPIYNLDKLIVMGRNYPNLQDVVMEYAKTLRGNVDYLKSPYYVKRSRIKAKKKPKKQFIPKEEKIKVAETKPVTRMTTIDGEDLW